MNKIIIAFGLVLFIQPLSSAQVEKEIKSSIKSVILYTQGAQIESEATVALQPGTMTLKLTGLSPYIREESIRINGDGSYTILNVQHQNDFINELNKDNEINLLKSKIEEIEFKIEEEQTRIRIIKEKLEFLNANKQINGSEQAINPETFKDLNAFYGNNIETLNLEILKKQRFIGEFQKDIQKLTNQLNSMFSASDLPTGTIIVSINSRQTKNSILNFTYLVDNASWFPTYDIRFLGINKPLKITYKANIKQNTGIDWKDVNIVLSTAKTNLSAQIPEFTPFYLHYYYPEIARALGGKVSGLEIMDNSGTPGSEPSISIRGISSLSANQPLYIVDGIPQRNAPNLSQDDIASMEVLKDASSVALYGSEAANGVIKIVTKSKYKVSSVPPTTTTKRETIQEYSIETPQTIQSNEKISNVIYKEADLDAGFEYQTIPALSENVFLIGRIPDWYKSEFIDGEANIYLENSFAGKSLINARNFEDTLELSFGADNNISIKRERVSEFKEDQFIGSNRKETTGYKITIRNNKSYPVTAKVTDQLPVSTVKEIQVEAIDVSGGVLEEESGKIEWDLKLNPMETREILIKYSVKYPKDKRVII